MNFHEGKPVYNGIVDCVTKVYKAEGFFGLYKGFTGQWLRLGPLTMAQFIIWEKLRNMFGLKAI